MTEEDDKSLFRRAMEQTGVIPRDYQDGRLSSEHSPRPGKRPAPGPGIRRADQNAAAQQIAVDKFGESPLPRPVAASIDETDGTGPVRFSRPGVSRADWKRLRRSEQPIDSSMDLHGMRTHEASRALERFIAEAERYRHRCVEIVHGKGLGSGPGGGVLRPLTIQFLRQQTAVLAFCSAPANQGGTGATLVLLRTS